jgi:hypothetical protein
MYFLSEETDFSSIFQYKIADPESIWLKFGRSGGDSVALFSDDSYIVMQTD